MEKLKFPNIINNMKKVMIYTGPMCNYCSAAKHLLNKKKVKYTEIDIGSDQSKMQEMQKKTKGARTIPQIFIGDIYVGGYTELKALEVAGKLDSLLEL
jgi:glutaredoxin 3